MIIFNQEILISGYDHIERSPQRLIPNAGLGKAVCICIETMGLTPLKLTAGTLNPERKKSCWEGLELGSI